MRHAALLVALVTAPTVAQDSADWRTVATDADRARLRDWRPAWIEGLAAPGANAIGARGDALLQPDSALARPLPPAGAYRCRAIRLGSKRAGQRAAVERPAVECRIEATSLRFDLSDGGRRMSGRLYPSNDARAVFLGTLAFAGESRNFSYGRDAGRDVAGYVERIGERRWRLVVPRPRFDAVIEVIEIVPAA